MQTVKQKYIQVFHKFPDQCLFPNDKYGFVEDKQTHGHDDFDSNKNIGHHVSPARVYFASAGLYSMVLPKRDLIS